MRVRIYNFKKTRKKKLKERSNGWAIQRLFTFVSFDDIHCDFNFDEHVSTEKKENKYFFFVHLFVSFLLYIAALQLLTKWYYSVIGSN